MLEQHANVQILLTQKQSAKYLDMFSVALTIQLKSLLARFAATTLHMYVRDKFP
jgi:hypothetical protein